MHGLTIKFPNEITDHILHSWTQESEDAKVREFPDWIPNAVRETLVKNGISNLYKHQFEFLDKFYQSNNVIISTGTASGKSLCYQVPILDEFLSKDSSTHLLLFPTKALAADQLLKFRKYLQKNEKSSRLMIESPGILGVYDGDTDRIRRVKIKKNTRLLFTNPDMLHVGILPQHPSWERFFKNLKIVVIDEVHSYSGVFGSHTANILRRLKRIAAYYGSKPKFILSSATIANPLEHACALVEENFQLVNKNFSRKNAKQFFFINPPIINKELGVRGNIFDETLPVLQFLYRNEKQTIAFGRSRLTVEKFLLACNSYFSDSEINLSAYRSGYTQAERRSTENRLREGNLDIVISTRALELGIDMGLVDAIVLLGYPGSISRFLQQTGRAGRKNQPSVAVLIASASPVDQFIVHLSDFVRGKNP